MAMKTDCIESCSQTDKCLALFFNAFLFAHQSPALISSLTHFRCCLPLLFAFAFLAIYMYVGMKAKRPFRSEEKRNKVNWMYRNILSSQFSHKQPAFSIFIHYFVLSPLFLRPSKKVWKRVGKNNFPSIFFFLTKCYRILDIEKSVFRTFFSLLIIISRAFFEPGKKLFWLKSNSLKVKKMKMKILKLCMFRKLTLYFYNVLFREKRSLCWALNVDPNSAQNMQTIFSSSFFSKQYRKTFPCLLKSEALCEVVQGVAFHF